MIATHPTVLVFVGIAATVGLLYASAVGIGKAGWIALIVSQVAYILIGLIPSFLPDTSETSDIENDLAITHGLLALAIALWCVFVAGWVAFSVNEVRRSIKQRGSPLPWFIRRGRTQG